MRPSSHRFNIKLISIIAVVILGLGGVGAGTFAILQKLKPQVHLNLPGKSAPATTEPTLSKGDQARYKAEQLVKENKLSDAKAAYQQAATAYTTDHNTTAAADATQQVTIIDATISTAGTSPQTPTPKVTGDHK